MMTSNPFEFSTASQLHKIGGPLRVGLIGMGAIGSRVLSCLKEYRNLPIEVVGVLAKPDSADRIRAAADGTPVFTRINDLLNTGPVLIAECASHEALNNYGETILRANADLVVASVGALADDTLMTRLTRAAAETDRQIILPSGAIGGLDILSAAKMAGLTQITYRGRKPPAAWRGSMAESIIDLNHLSEASVFFSGTAREAAGTYPKNANVAATVALATLGLDALKVELIADPQVRGNTHEIEAEGKTGRIDIRIEGKPDPENPRTSMTTGYSVAWSIIKRCILLTPG